MAAETKTKSVREIRPETLALNDPASARRSQTSRIKFDDDIIGSLADAHENRRARQVVEWVRQQSVRRSA